jgi:hypothetical protein
VEEGVEPSNAMRVSVLMDGKKRVMIGVSGAAIIVAIRDPIVVKIVWRSVAKTGGNSAPVRTFYKGCSFININREPNLQILTRMTLPGMLHAFAHTDIRDRTPRTCKSPVELVPEYPLRAHTREDTSAMVLGNAYP